MGIKLRKLSVLSLVLPLILFFQNCSQKDFDTVDQEQKTAVLEETVVLNPTNRTPAQVNQPLEIFQPSVSIPVVTDEGNNFNPDQPTANSASFTFANGAQCSSKSGNSELGFSTDLFDSLKATPRLTVTDIKTNQVVCAVTSLKDIPKFGEHMMTIPNCQLTEGSQYRLQMTATLSSQEKFEILGTFDVTAQQQLGSVDMSYYHGSLSPLSGAQISVYRQVRNCDNLMTDNQGNSNGLTLVSPLIIDLGAKDDQRKKIEISSIQDGIYFDILGWNGNHMPKKIGWTSNSRYAFLTLPDQHGLVRNIDQLFGNNTRGPDSDFADNGFLALAKYDSNKDGLITLKDEVFSKLRLWTDANYNGFAEANELKSLDQAGINLVDLNYDSNYREKDQYGNETTFKSIVRHNDGHYSLIFDLWFVYQD